MYRECRYKSACNNIRPNINLRNVLGALRLLAHIPMLCIICAFLVLRPVWSNGNPDIKTSKVKLWCMY